MTLNDNFVTRFIRERIIDPNLSINFVPSTKPIHLSFVEQFEANGWRSQPVPNQPKRFKMFTPDGLEVVTVKGLSATRHPATTTKICRFKHFTKKMLDLAEVPNPVGSEFFASEKDIAAEYFQKMPKPVVIKPTNGASSKGVTVGVSTIQEFEKSWDHALSEGNERTKVLLEELVDGIEIRAYVIDGTVMAAVVRLPPYVLGNGHSTVTELMEVERIARLVNRKVRSKIVPDWNFVAELGHSPTSVPERDEILLLHPFKTTSLGAKFFDVTDDLSDEIKEIAVRATQAIPQLEIAGIDLLVEDLNNPGSAKVLEVNTTPATDLHRYPTYGIPRPVEKYIADFYDREYRRDHGIRKA